MFDFTTLLGRPLTDGLVQDIARDYSLSHDYDSELDRRYLNNDAAGLSLVFEPDRLTTVFLYGQYKDGCQRFPGRFSKMLDFDSTQADVRRVHGVPEATGAPDPTSKIAPHSGWDRYVFPSHVLHFTYCADESGIDLVTLMLPEVAPNL